MPHSRRTKRRPSITKRAKITALVRLALTVALAVTGLSLRQQEAQEAAALEAAQYTSPPIDLAGGKPVMSLLGDSYTAGSDNDVVWGELVTSEMNMILDNNASGGASFTSTVKPISDQISNVRSDATMIVVAGSRNDKSSKEAVQEQAWTVYRTLEANHPEATIVVIGPIWDSSAPTQAALDANEGVRAAAEAAGLPFIDALSANWLGDAALIQDDNAHPNDDGQRAIAARAMQELSKLGLNVDESQP